ncbi:MAG: hypothetical protein A2Y97_06010 [Nitrospirae bacterium RBG_13_39_12]|nr:MAG: hypothetical protein A2Y97_06010 [Nitrospirae bacterium RBG_13_39_12]
MFLSSCSNSILKPSGWVDNDQNIEKDILELVNDTRSKGTTCGNQYYKAVQPLIWNDMLAQAALNHSTDMAKNGFLSHKGSDGSDPERRLSMVGYKWVLYGENIGQGYRIAEEAVREWLKSTGHCKNIMNSEFKEAGSAYAKSSSLRIYWTLVFGTSSQ